MFDEFSSLIVTIVLEFDSADVVSPFCPEVDSVLIAVPSMDNVDIPDVVGELVCCVVVVVDKGIEVGGHVRGSQVQTFGAVEQSCDVLMSIPMNNCKICPPFGILPGN